MCGILFTNKLISDLSNIIQFLKNRGPDYTNLKTINNYNFIHVLLSMTGVNYTIQPFIYNNDSIVVLFNGEIYNYKEFGNFNSDGECIIEAYLKYGDDFIKYLDGEFAILLFDFNLNILYFSSDIFCIKPLWYSIENNTIGVSTYKSCLEKLDFTNIIEIPHNTTIKVDMITYNIINTFSVYDFDLNQYKTNYDDWNIAFENSILKRTQGIKHKIYIGLSSGYDSGLIACVLNKYNIPYKSYTINGSENQEIINKRISLHDNYEILNISSDEFNEQKNFLKENCEPYNLFIDNDELSNLKIWENKQKDYLQNNVLDETNVEYKLILNKINTYKFMYNKALNKSIYEDNGGIGLGIICKKARPNGELIYLTGSGADEITSDYGWKGIKHYRHSTIGGYFPQNLTSVFPWKNFFENTQKAYLRKEEYISGTYGIEGRYPFLDKQVVQEFLWLSNDLKNKWYKAPIYNYLKNNNYPFDENKKVGFNCGMSDGTNNNIVTKIATRTQIGETNDESLIVKFN